MCILEEVDQRLLQLRGIEAADAISGLQYIGKFHLRTQLADEALPHNGRVTRCGQLGEACVVADEAF